MLKILMGLFLIVVSVMLSFIPPFIFGLPVAFLACGLFMAGLGKTAGQAVRGGLSAASYLKDKKGLPFKTKSGDYDLPDPGRHGWRQ